MKRVYILLIALLLITKVSGQNIAFMKMCDGYTCEYLDNAIIAKIKESNLNVKSFNNTNLFFRYNNKISELNNDQKENLIMFNHDYIILHKSEKSNQNIYVISDGSSLDGRTSSQSEFIIFNVKTNKSTIIKLVISTFDCGDKIETCSNIDGFVKSIKDFVQGSYSSSNSNDEEVNNTTEPVEKVKPEVTVKKKTSFFGGSNSEAKFKLVRVKEKNASTNTPIFVDIYDKSQQLNVGDNIIITRTDEVKIPGERKTIKSETTIGKAKITEDFNKPLYTAKLIGTAGNNLKDYKDGDENYSVVKGEDSKEIVSVPKVMVIPEQIDQYKLVNGEYQLSKEELLLIGALKNKLENNKYTTIGFETAIKTVYENRVLNENTKNDIKSLVLEASGADFYVEFKSIYDNSTVTNNTKIILSDGGSLTKTTEMLGDRIKWVSGSGNVYKQLNKNEAKEKFWPNLENVIYLYDESRNLMIAIHDNGNGNVYKLKLGQNLDYSDSGITGKVTKAPTLPCTQNFNFKIRNYATSEDVASDIKQLNTCGTPDDYKNFAQSILNEGALNKINKEFKDVLINGKKIAVNFTILNSSSASFDKNYSGMRLEEHIQYAVQAYSLNYRQNGVVNKRMSFSEVYIPSINEITGQKNYPNDFALSVIKYLKDVVGVECEKSVIGQNVNFNVK